MTSVPMLTPGGRLDRRTVLGLAAGAVAAPVLAGLPAQRAVAAATAAPGRPSGSWYVRYEDLYRSGDSLQAVINKVSGNRILTLPEGTFTIRDFRNGYYDGIRIGTDAAAGCRGIAGSGRNTVIRVLSNTATRSLRDGFCGNQITIANKQWALLSNFSLRGGPQNGMIYDGIRVSNCPDARLTWLYLRGGSRGYAQSPPGETFGINVLRSDRVAVFDSEVDGRDDAGTRVAAAPIGWNFGRDARVIRTYAHHGVASMLTFYETTNIYTEDYHMFSTSTGSGTKSGHGINHEQSQGLIRHIRPKLYVHGIYSRAADRTGTTGHHFMFANTRQDVPDIEILEPTFDPGPGSTGMMAVQIQDRYTAFPGGQHIRTAPYVRKNGITLAVSHHPVSGYGDKDPKRYYTWVH